MQQCPWCQAELSMSQLYALDDRLHSECEQCGEPIRNGHVREALSILPSLVSLLGVLMWGLHPASWLIPLILYPFSKILLTRPRKVQYEPYLCLQCRRDDAEYRHAGDRVCDECLTKNEQAAKTNAR